MSTTAVDLAKIGRLYLNGGKFNGNQIVSSEWIKETLTPNPKNNGIKINGIALVVADWIPLVISILQIL